jgi:hypothetical protein
MELHQWLDMPENAGKATWLADQLSRTKAAVSLWRESGVPLGLIPRVAEVTGGAVTVDAMLQHAMRCRAAAAARPSSAGAAVVCNTMCSRGAA